MISKNPLNNKKYNIPKSLNDKTNIDEFLNKNSGKEVIVVQGLGFVGAVMALVCANSSKKDYAVIGVDLANSNSYWRIKSINEGEFPVISSDQKIYTYFNNTKIKNNFYATYDPYAYSKADVIIVDINLDVDKKTDYYGNLLSYDVNLNNFEKAITSIGNYCKEDCLILIETTVPPGTCEKIVKPIIIDSLKRRKLSYDKFKLGHSYERVMPGPDYVDSIENFYRVFSGLDKKSELKVEEFLRTIIRTDEYPLTKLENTNATEIAKVLENSYRAKNIAFMVEWSRFAEEAGVNLYEVIDAIKMRPTHSNMMYPGIGVGGYCLTKDPLLASWSKMEIFGSKKDLDESVKGVKTNDKMPLYAFEYLKNKLKLKNFKNKNILLFGVSYRSDVGDTRYTPVERFYKFLISSDARIDLHDPYISYWEELKININFNKNSFDDIEIDYYDIIIITTSHSEYKNSSNFMNFILKNKKLKIFDSVGIFSKDELIKIRKKHIVFVLGNGNLN